MLVTDDHERELVPPRGYKPIDGKVHLYGYIEALAKLDRYRAAGHGRVKIAKALDISHDTVRLIHSGRCIPRLVTIRQILDGPEPGVRGIKGHVPALGTMRRLQALQRIGYTRADLKRRLQMNYPGSWQPLVHEHKAARVAALYRELSRKPGPSAQARERARAAGWPSPAAWDDIDDPTAKPQGLVTYDRERKTA